MKKTSKGFALHDLFKDNKFKYNQKQDPALNYRLFQQAINFSNGVEFLSSSNESRDPIIYLIKVPGLEVDLDKTRAMLEKFNNDLLNHFTSIIMNQKDIFKRNEIFFNLYNVIMIQQEEYHLGKEKFFGSVTIREFAYKEIKELNLPIIQSTYRGTFLNSINTGIAPVKYKNLRPDMKRFLSSLYLLKRQANLNLIKGLKKFKDLLFYKKNAKHYYYSGDTADIVEIAIALVETGKLNVLNESNIDLNIFSKDLCDLLGTDYTRLSNYLPTIIKRKKENKLALEDLKKGLKTFIID